MGARALRSSSLTSGRAIVVAIAALLGGAAVACGGAAPPKAAAAPPAASALAGGNDDRSGFEGKGVGFYRSDRLGLSLPLPDLLAWTIVDRADLEHGWLVATHPPTGTRVRVRRYEETALAGRRECQTRAQLSNELPNDAEITSGRYETLEDEAVHRPKGWDGWRWVAYEAIAGGALEGHVFLVAGRQQSCLVVHVVTEVRSDTEVNELADRLELFRSRVVSGIAVDRAAEPDDPRPDLPPTPFVP